MIFDLCISTHAHFITSIVIVQNPVPPHVLVSRFFGSLESKFRISVFEIIPDSTVRCVVLRDILRKL